MCTSNVGFRHDLAELADPRVQDPGFDRVENPGRALLVLGDCEKEGVGRLGETLDRRGVVFAHLSEREMVTETDTGEHSICPLCRQPTYTQGRGAPPPSRAHLSQVG